MFTQNTELCKRIKKLSYQMKLAWESNNPNKTVSTYKMYESCTNPFDADSAALKASSNKFSEHFGKSVEDIKAIWNSKGIDGQNRGNSIDDYITSKILGYPYPLENAEEIFVNKSKGVDKFFADVSGRLGELIGNELWLCSMIDGINVRSDSMFVNGNTIFVCEWKNISKFKTHNVKDKCFGPLEGYDNCDLIKVNIQVYTYKYILEQYFGTEFSVIPIIVNFVEDDYNVIPTLLTNYKELIPKIAKNAHNK